HAIAETDQVKDVNSQPHHPGNKSRDTYLPYFDDAKGTPNCRHVAFVKVVKWRICLPARYMAGNHGGDVVTFLHSDRGHAGQWLTILHHDRCVGTYKNSRMPRY